MSDDPPSLDELLACAGTLEKIADDRGILAQLPVDVRQKLLISAGRVVRPIRDDKARLAKAFQRKERSARKAHDQQLLSTRGIRGEARDQRALPPPLEAPRGPRLQGSRDCYVCKAPYQDLHFFYSALCPTCGDFNFAKRSQTAPLEGRVALVTGGRIKIGYQTALILLRAGARVLLTSRFPRDAAARYANEPDYERFAPRLQIHGLDLRHLPSVELFASYLDRTLDRLDILVHNAAQTVRRPVHFYRHLLAAERESGNAPGVLEAHESLKRALALEASNPRDALMRLEDGGAARGLIDSAGLAMVPLTEEDHAAGDEVFPPNVFDAHGQQLDLRAVNSWRLTLADVSTPELIEVHLVNALAPFILTARLKPLMIRDRTYQKHVINVSAMEAQYARNTKTDRHPHTNMAKAALNMLTRTSASDYLKDGVHMNSVDTGWVTDEDPHHHVTRKQAMHDFHAPLDTIDGAARILDPLFTGLITGEHPWGQFFKDYRPTAW